MIVSREERTRLPLLLERKRKLRRAPFHACEKWVLEGGWVEECVVEGRLVDFDESGWLVREKELVGLCVEEEEEEEGMVVV